MLNYSDAKFKKPIHVVLILHSLKLKGAQRALKELSAHKSEALLKFSLGNLHPK